MKFSRSRTHALALCALFTALTAVGAFIRIPVPIVPFTLQLMFTTLAGLLLGPRLGFASVVTYLILGLIGLPIFTAGGGPAYVLQPTFGYLIGFALGTWVTGTIAHAKGQPSHVRLLIACFAGLFIIYGCGMIYYWLIVTFYLGTGIGLWALFIYCFAVFVPGNVVQCLLSAALAHRLLPLLYHSQISQ